jgi:hypothetical protein
MLIRTPPVSSVSVNAALVNCAPWFGAQRFEPHQPHQPLHPLAVDLTARQAQLRRHPP